MELNIVSHRMGFSALIITFYRDWGIGLAPFEDICYFTATFLYEMDDNDLWYGARTLKMQGNVFS